MFDRHFGRSAFLAVFIFCCVSFIYAQAPNVKQPATSKIKLGFSIENLKVERWQTDSAAFQKRAQALGAEVIVADAAGNREKQLKDATDLFKSGIQVLVLVAHDPKTGAEIIEAAKAKKVHVITYEAPIYAGEDLFITIDPVAIGRLQVSTLTDRAPSGNYVILQAPADQSSGFHNGQLEALQPFVSDGRIKIIADKTASDWSATQAYMNMVNVLESNPGKITAVVAINDAVAAGAIQALEERSLAGKVLVSGQDAELSALTRLVMGTQTMTVYKPIAREAEAAAEAAVSLAQGKAASTNGTYSNGGKSVPAILFDPVVVTKDNIRQTVIKDGFQTVDEIKRSLPKEKWSAIE